MLPSCSSERQTGQCRRIQQRNSYSDWRKTVSSKENTTGDRGKNRKTCLLSALVGEKSLCSGKNWSLSLPQTSRVENMNIPKVSQLLDQKILIVSRDTVAWKISEMSLHLILLEAIGAMCLLCFCPHYHSYTMTVFPRGKGWRLSALAWWIIYRITVITQFLCLFLLKVIMIHICRLARCTPTSAPTFVLTSLI